MCKGRGRRLLGSFLLFFFGATTTCVHANIHITALFQYFEFPCVTYFDARETRWPYFDQVLNGRVAVLPTLNVDQIFLDNNNETGKNSTRPPFDYDVLDDDVELDRWKDSPKFLLVNFGSTSFEAAMHNTSLAAEKLGVDFVVLVVAANVPWKERFVFWWSHRFPGSPNKELLPGGNATHPYFFIAVGPGYGSEILALIEREVLSFGIYTPDDLSFGIDSTNAMPGRDLVARLLMYMIMVLCVSRYVGNGRGNNSTISQMDGNRSSYMQFTGEDLGLGEIQSSAVQDCPVCLESMHPGERVRILPCRHALHHDCITGWFERGKYSCPMCKMDLQIHLAEQRRASLSITTISTARRGWRIWPFGRRIENLDPEDQLILSVRPDSARTSNEESMGDLELTEEPRTIV